MKVGFVLECGPMGADKKVLDRLAKLACLGTPGFSTEFRPLDQKTKLLKDCGETASLLFSADKCDRVFVIWDLDPAWGGKACRKQDRELALKSLETAGLTSKVGTQVFLVCIEKELEGWLLADERALSDALQELRGSHPVQKISKVKKPDNTKNPKGRLKKIWKENTGREFNDVADADKIAAKIGNFSRLRRSPTFCRFYEKLTGRPLS